MAEMEETKEASLNLTPDAWRNKTGSGYSVTEGMEYEPFTRQFRHLYNKMQESELQYTGKIKNNIFIGGIVIQSEEERIRENLFTEVRIGKKREDPVSEISRQELLIVIGFLMLLFLILVRMTFRKKKHRSAG